MKMIVDQGTDILIFEGEIVFEKSNEIKEEAKKLIQLHESQNLIIDLEKVDLLDSSGIGVLISLFKHIREKNGRLVLAAPNFRVKKVIKLTMLEKIMDVYETVEQAEASFQ